MGKAICIYKKTSKVKRKQVQARYQTHFGGYVYEAEFCTNIKLQRYKITVEYSSCGWSI